MSGRSTGDSWLTDKKPVIRLTFEQWVNSSPAAAGIIIDLYIEATSGELFRSELYNIIDCRLRAAYFKEIP